MKSMKRFLWLAAVLCLTFSSTVSFAGGKKGQGSDVPYPLSCVDFSGKWLGDNGSIITIVQEGCKKITFINKKLDLDLIIDPDNKMHEIVGKDWTGRVLYRWDSTQYGNVLETHRFIESSEYKTYEASYLELKSADSLVEMTYRTVHHKDGQVSREDKVVHYRRESEDGSCQQ